MESDLLLELTKNFKTILLGCERVTLHHVQDKDELLIKFWDKNLHGELYVSGQLIEQVSTMQQRPDPNQLELPR